MNALLKDLRYAARALLKSPGFTAVAALTLALGIGANTAIFSPVDAVLLHPLDFEDADRLAMVYETNLAKGWDRFSVAPANYLDWKSRARFLGDLGAFGGDNFNLTGRDEPERFRFLDARVLVPLAWDADAAGARGAGGPDGRATVRMNSIVFLSHTMTPGIRSRLDAATSDVRSSWLSYLEVDRESILSCYLACGGPIAGSGVARLDSFGERHDGR